MKRILKYFRITDHFVYGVSVAVSAGVLTLVAQGGKLLWAVVTLDILGALWCVGIFIVYGVCGLFAMDFFTKLTKKTQE